MELKESTLSRLKLPLQNGFHADRNRPGFFAAPFSCLDRPADMLDAATEPSGLAGLSVFSAAIPDHAIYNCSDSFLFSLQSYGTRLEPNDTCP
uniref:Uncharacterized protein n=1 Tax=viral metagenome TaxID=1070528 RepID=A0A6C0K2L8_9ZZZZ